MMICTREDGDRDVYSVSTSAACYARRQGRDERIKIIVIERNG